MEAASLEWETLAHFVTLEELSSNEADLSKWMELCVPTDASTWHL